MDQEPVVYAIADTHLGLREWAGHHDSPVIVADFLRWLAAETPFSIIVLEEDAIVMRQLQPPTHMLMLGDILELWDADNLPLLGSAAQVEAGLDRLNAEKIYLLGNHDNILEMFASQDPFRSVEIPGEVYPPPDSDGVVKPLAVGPRSYLFIHGHQFDETGTFSPLLSSLRQFGASLGAYAWVFLILTLGLGLWQGIFAWQGIDPPFPWALFWTFVIALSLFWGPRFYMSWARRIHRWLSGGRYNRKRSLRGLQAWWSDFQSKVEFTND
ncbi:MAG: metallophosphoesterase, partial [Thermoplasmata archaeon]